jgi:hypothetical protein
MIWFTCKQCGKRHGRDESLTGTLVFCDCGHGNRVPWASSAAPEPLDAEPAPRPRARFPAAPVPRAERRDERREPDFPPAPPPRRVREVRRVRPNFCFQHDEDASTDTCADCRLPLCKACVVMLQGRTLCGPCKNFRVRGVGRAPRVLPLAVIALVVALAAAPVALVLSVIGLGSLASSGSRAVGVLLCLVGLVLPAGGLVLGALAWRQIESRPDTGGKALAASGAAAGLVCVLWSLTVALIVIFKP